MEPALILTTALFIFLLVTVAKGVRQVPQGNKWVVQRLGKYYTSLNPGLNFVIPYIDSIAYKVTTKDIVLDIPSQEVITKDNAVIMTNAVAYINIVSPEKAVYGVEDYTLAIQTLVQTSLRSIVGEIHSLELPQLLNFLGRGQTCTFHLYRHQLILVYPTLYEPMLLLPIAQKHTIE